MSNHRTRVQTRRLPGGGVEFFGVCDCRAFGPPERFQTTAEDWERAHRKHVEQVRAHLQGRNPSLTDQHAYYRRMERDSRAPLHEREQWKILADGLEHRIGLTDHTPRLF